MSEPSVEPMTTTTTARANDEEKQQHADAEDVVAAAVAAAAAVEGQLKVSEQQAESSVSLAALQEASAMVLHDHTAAAIAASPIVGSSNKNNKKRKESSSNEPALPSPPSPVKRPRAAPTRVSWDDRMSQLKEYKKQHGNLLIPIRYKINPSLGKFVHNTREQYKLFHKRCPPHYKKKCSLTAERIAQLDEIGFVWSTQRTKRQNEDWEGRLKQLKAYKEKHGDCLVPHGYEEDPSFAEWIHRQRTTYASMLKAPDKANDMVKDRMNKLTEVGFNFTVHTDKWTDHWQQLKAYKETHGNCEVPTHYAVNPKLGRWVHTQRHQRRLQMKGKKSCMTQERVDLLDQLGFSWEVRSGLERPRVTWQQRFDELKDFRYVHGHFKVPSDTHPELHSWAQEQRSRLRALANKGKDISRRMAPERVRALHELGFTTDTGLCMQNVGLEVDDTGEDHLEPISHDELMMEKLPVDDTTMMKVEGDDMVEPEEEVNQQDEVDAAVAKASIAADNAGEVVAAEDDEPVDVTEAV